MFTLAAEQDVRLYRQVTGTKLERDCMILAEGTLPSFCHPFFIALGKNRKIHLIPSKVLLATAFTGAAEHLS